MIFLLLSGLPRIAAGKEEAGRRAQWFWGRLSAVLDMARSASSSLRCRQYSTVPSSAR